MNIEKVSNNAKALLWLFSGIIGQVIVFVLSNYASAKYSPRPSDAFIISGVILVMGFACWLIVRPIMRGVKKSEYNGRIAGLGKVNNAVHCTKNDSILCPLNVGFRDYGLVLKINEKTSNKDRLFDKEYVYEIEKNGEQGLVWKDIWIFSENLSSEIDPSNNRAEPVLITNITSNHTKYTIFYLSIQSQLTEIETRKQALRNSLSSRDRDRLSFVPIDVSNGYLGKNTLPLLCGSIMFSRDKDSKGLPVFTEGYLSFRKSIEDIPIYYKMPRCMLREYSLYFKNINN